MKALEWALDRAGHLVVRFSRSPSRWCRGLGYLLAAAAFCGLLPLVVLFVVTRTIPRGHRRD